MINRYSRQIMRDVWSDQSKYAIWFEIEMLAHEAMESIGLIEKGLTKKIRDKLKDIIFDEDYWKISASHDGYLKDYHSIHERNIEFNVEKMTFFGVDKIIKKKMIKAYKFDIRFHFEPGVKLMKTQDNKTILIELKDEGWKFTCNNYKISINNGLYFGKKNLYTDNQNILVSGISNQKFENIEWELKKI